MRYQITIGEYCAEDSAQSAQGEFLTPPDLNQLAQAGKDIGAKVLMMERLGVLLIIKDKASIHIHQDGRITITGIKGKAQAEKILELLLKENQQG